VEEEAATTSLGDIAAHDVSPSTFIHTGLELEEYQYAPRPFHQRLFEIEIYLLKAEFGNGCSYS
jgi:hypothetical protein